MRKLLLLQFLCVASFAFAQIMPAPDTLDNPVGEDEIPTISLSDNDSDAGQFVPGLLSSGRDPFTSAVAFNFSAFRYRVRGYDSEFQTAYLNGVPVNELEDDRTDFRDWRGLNDVMRNRTQSFDIAPNDYAFGGVGGAWNVDTRALQQRKQLRASYSISNRSYRNRLMLTYSSGALKNGWGVSLSGSHSCANEGYQPGTFFNGWAYFASIDKKLNEKHRFNLTVFGSPAQVGRANPSVQEAYNLAGSNYYNPNWGWQDGRKRNHRVDNVHQPMAIFRHDWKLNKNTDLTTSASYQAGRNGRSTLDWFDARDPRPDYYTRLPSYAQEPYQAEQVTNTLLANDTLMQIDWNNLYYSNRLNTETVGQTTGNRSQYILAENRTDTREANLHSNIRHIVNPHLQLQGGLGYQYYRGMNFMTVLDLLGGDFIVDVDKYAERDFAGNENIIQNDLNNPNRIVKVGDRYSYDYDMNVRKGFGWGQAIFTYNHIDAFVSAEGSNTRFWRVGNTTNGRFPDNSFGRSETQSFFNYAAKAGATYKINGRNFLYVRGFYQTRPPIVRNAFVSPRTRDAVADSLRSSMVYSAEGGYQLRAPGLKIRATGYYTQFKNQTETRSFYHDEQRSFVNYTMTGLGELHVGTELAVEAKIYQGLSASAVAAIGQNFYNSRPNATITQDNNAAVLENRTVYILNYYAGQSPQQAYSASLKYQGKKFWFANLSFNYIRQNWVDINFDRRTSAGVSYDAYGVDRVLPGSGLWKEILAQEQLPDAYTLDFFGGKSWRMKSGDMIFLNVGINNLLNSQFISAGFEQLRFDYAEKNVAKFPPRYFYGYGTNYFISLAVSI